VTEVSKPGTLTKKTKIIIAVVVVIVVAVVVFVVIYFTVIKKNNQNLGPNKFGSVQVQDQTTHVTGAKYQPGDTILLKYAPTPEGFSGNAVWSFSVDRGITFPVTIPGDGSGNSASFVVPGNVFSQECVFKVADKDNTEDFVTSEPVPIIPGLIITKGAGVEANDTLYQDRQTSTTLEMDIGLLGINNESDWEVKTSTDAKNFSNSVPNQVVSINLETSELSWIPSQVQNKVYYQISTTNLKANNYPAELSVVSQFPIDIKDAKPVCPGGGDDFQICNVIMTSTTNKSNNFTPGETVKLEFNFIGAFDGLATWSYNLGDGDVNIHPTAGPGIEGDSVTYTWTITPDTIFTTDFVLTVTSGAVTKTTENYTVQPSFTWTSPSAGDAVTVFASGASFEYITTTMDFTSDAATGFTKWTVGTSRADGSNLVFHENRIYRVSNVNASQTVIIWYLAGSDLPINVGQEEDLILYFKAENSAGNMVLIKKTTGTVKFMGKNFNPVYSPQKMGSSACTVGVDSSGFLISDCTTTTPLNWFMIPDGTIRFGQHQGKSCVFDPTNPNNTTPLCWYIPETSTLQFKADTLRDSTEQQFQFQSHGLNTWGIHVSGLGCATWSTTQGARFGNTNGCLESNNFFGWTADVF
jgi:hypothetical protein